MKKIIAAAIYIVALLPFSLLAQQKQSYSIFNPRPASQMRDMETDRPDVTESPFTVDAGHFQYETDLVRFKTERSEDSKQNTTAFNKANLKIGITNSTALQIGFESFNLQRETDLLTNEKTKTHGIGDLTVRVKQNLIGNDGGDFAMALLPYIKFPTAKYTDDSKYEGGLILPMQLKLPGEWKIGMQVEADRLKDDDIAAMHTEFLQSLTVSHETIKNLDGIAETYYTYDFKKHHWSNFLNAALQLSVGENFKLDAGFNYGIQHDAERNYFIGTSFRL